MKYLSFLFLISLSFNQEVFTEYLILEHDTIDVFSYQIPQNYDSNNQHPLVVTFHQWGGNQNSNYYTEFDEEANARNWIMLSPYGGSSNNYNHQGAQAMVENEILWMIEHYNINEQKIYMVGGSMGGAAGAIYANNHLDPSRPMVAATASASGILDCERRAIEMDGNNSMIEWFGGEWYEVPFEYHRNSAVYFADSTQSMHYNLKYTPLYLDFGVTETHRTHAEDLYNLLLGYNENIWIDSLPTGSHGYSVFDENHVCNWLSQFELINNPDNINVNLDEPSRAYWVEPYNIHVQDEFIRLTIDREYLDISLPWLSIEGYAYTISKLQNSDSLILHILETEYLSENNNTINIAINSGSYMYNIQGFSGSLINNIENIQFIGNEPNAQCFINNFTIDSNNTIWIELSGHPFEDEVCTNSEAYFLSFEFNNIFHGDINQDGIWNIIDVILVMNHILDQEQLNNEQQQNADMNNDNIINIIDIINIVNLILEIE